MRKRGEDAQIQCREHCHSGGGNQTETMVEQQQIQHDERKTDSRDHNARRKSVLTQGRSDGLTLSELEAHGQRSGLEHGLQRLRLIKRVASRDGNVAIGNFPLHGGRGLNHSVKNNDDFAVSGRKVLGCLCKRSSTFAIQLEVDRIIGCSLGSLADRYALDVITRDDGRVRALVDMQGELFLSRGELVAQRVSHRLLLDVSTRIDLVFHGFVSKRIKARKFKLARFADGGKSVLGVGQPGNLDENLIRALQGDRGLRGAKGVYATLDDRTRLLHVFGRDSSTVIALCRKHHGKAALDIETLVDLLLGRREHKHGSENEQRRSNNEPDIAAVHVLRRPSPRRRLR